MIGISWNTGKIHIKNACCHQLAESWDKIVRVIAKQSWLDIFPELSRASKVLALAGAIAPTVQLPVSVSVHNVYFFLKWYAQYLKHVNVERNRVLTKTICWYTDRN